MRIAHIAPPWIRVPPKNYGGTEVVIYNLVEELVAQGHDVTLFAPGDAITSARHISFFPTSLHEAGIPWAAHLMAFYHLYRSLAYANEFDIIHTHLSSSGDMYIFPLTAPLTTPHVTTLHSRFPFERVGTWMGEADTFYVEQWASQVPVVAISEAAKADVPHPLRFVGVVHHGISTKDFELPAVKRENFFMWIGRFFEEKGPHLAIEAAVAAGVPIVLAGTIDKQQAESVDYFKKCIEPFIDNDRVRYVGPVNLEQKALWLAQARGFLNPIQWKEPFGMVMLEAMASGCPVISFDEGAARELVIHGETGFLVQDVSEMAHYISRIDEIDRERTRAYVEQHYSIRSMTQNYVEIYKDIIGTKQKTLAGDASRIV